MTRQIYVRPQAETEILDTRRWYEERRSGLGAEFAEALSTIVSRIADNPLSFTIARGDTRRAVLQRFPYVAYFRLRGDDIVILSVHGRQDPRKWQERT